MKADPTRSVRVHFDGDPIYVVDGARTPFLKARNRPGPFAASDLATDAGRALLARRDPSRARATRIIGRLLSSAVALRALAALLWLYRSTGLQRAVRALKQRPGGNILTDGSSQLVHALLEHGLVDELHLLVYPISLGTGKRVLPNGVLTKFVLKHATPYPTGVVGLHYALRP